jgi:dihydroceramidase
MVSDVASCLSLRLFPGDHFRSTSLQTADCFDPVYYSISYALKRKHRQVLNGHDFMSFALFTVGVASFVYHGTLRQTMQLFDDLSMLLLGASFLLTVYTARQTPVVRSVFSVVICSGVTIVSIIYLRTGKILFHTYSFVAILTLTWPRLLYLMRTRSRAKPPVSSTRGARSASDNSQSSRKGDEPTDRKDAPSRRGRRSTYRLAKAGLLLTVAFILWNIDLEKCSELRSLRKRIGLPWAFLLELHGWWHILTAAAAFEFMTLARDICSDGE